MGTVEDDQPDETPADVSDASQGSPVQLDQVVGDGRREVCVSALQQIAALPEICTGVDVTSEAGICIVTFNGREISGGAIGEMLVRLAETEVNMVLDFSGVDFLSSGFLRGLYDLNKKLRDCNKQLRFCGVRQELVDTFHAVRLDKIVDIYDTREEAIASFTNPIPPRRIDSQ